MSTSTDGNSRLASTSGASTLADGRSMSALASGPFPFIPNFGNEILGILMSNFPEGFSISISSDGPFAPTSSSASGKSASTSALGPFPFNPNFGKLISGMLMSNFPLGFSISTSREGVSTLTSKLGPSIFGKSASISALGFFPLKPNLGRLMSGKSISNFPDGFSTLISRDGAFTSTSKLASGKSPSISAFGVLPLKPNLGK